MPLLEFQIQPLEKSYIEVRKFTLQFGEKNTNKHTVATVMVQRVTCLEPTIGLLHALTITQLRALVKIVPYFMEVKYAACRLRAASSKHCSSIVNGLLAKK